jgi:hypothetical protein
LIHAESFAIAAAVDFPPLSVQWLFDLMTVETGNAAWFAEEFGIALAVTSTLFEIPLLRSVRGCLLLHG